MKEVKHYKVTALPEQCEADAIYFVNGENGIDQYITDNEGMPKLLTIGVLGLKKELKATNNIPDSTSPIEIDWSLGVSFYVPELTADTTFTFTNVVENKIIDLLIKGEHAVTLPANVNTDDVSLDGTVWSVIQLKAYNVGGNVMIKASSFNLE